MLFNFKKNENKLRRLYNKETNIEIGKVKIANSFSSRLLGLMFKRNAEYPLLFEIPNKIKGKHRSSIHGFFMRFDLKLVFIDDENVIYEIADLIRLRGTNGYLESVRNLDAIIGKRIVEVKRRRPVAFECKRE